MPFFFFFLVYLKLVQIRLPLWSGLPYIFACMLNRFSCVWLFATLWTVVHQAPLSMGFSRQEYWSGLPCPPPGDLPDPGIKPESLTSPTFPAGFFTTSTTWEALPYLFSSLLINRFPPSTLFFSFLFLVIYLLKTPGCCWCNPDFSDYIPDSVIDCVSLSLLFPAGWWSHLETWADSGLIWGQDDFIGSSIQKDIVPDSLSCSDVSSYW